jgi:hypothetical protein
MYRLAFAVLGSCSFAFMTPPTAAMTPACSDPIEAPIVDTVIASGAAAALGGSLVSGWFGNKDSLLLTERLLLLAAPWIFLNGLSAVYGYVAHDQCHRLVEANRTRSR